jgi:DNA (cytosine-5)-methyltransferase 1
MTKLLDLYCGAGGCSVGYNRAGFDVVGVDIKPQPNYPYEFVQSDVFKLEESFIDEFDIIHASPPCQAYTWGTRQGRLNKFPDLISATRELVDNKDYIIENVQGAPLIKPMKLCGTMFNLKVIRHRLFESNIWIYPPGPCNHNGTVGRGDYITVAGHGGNSKTFKYKDWCEAMCIDWMTKYELTQAIPPTYTEWIGELLIQ